MFKKLQDIGDLSMTKTKTRPPLSFSLKEFLGDLPQLFLQINKWSSISCDLWELVVIVQIISIRNSNIFAFFAYLLTRRFSKVWTAVSWSKPGRKPNTGQKGFPFHLLCP